VTFCTVELLCIAALGLELLAHLTDYLQVPYLAYIGANHTIRLKSWHHATAGIYGHQRAAMGMCGHMRATAGILVSCDATLLPDVVLRGISPPPQATPRACYKKDAGASASGEASSRAETYGEQRLADNRADQR
jgi:hypothetical protein